MTWNITNSQSELDGFIDSSTNRPIIFFKHSPTCSISHIAKARLDDWKQASGSSVYLIDVISQRPLSRHLAERLDVKHESPQVLVVHNQECIYDASHLGILPQELDEVLEQL
ncbi:MAG: bacillithiol system redox-active protein YtxJ [Lewinellaceae bacterium]|nr:bacillithiol system redox-active protein YtxJ [Lewinellaceae bacterium]